MLDFSCIVSVANYQPISQNLLSFRVVAVFELQMISLPFSVGTYYPNNHLTPPTIIGLITRKNSHIIASSAAASPVKYSATSLLSRRETLGIAFCFSFLQFLDPKPYSAAAPPCEFTEAPSGLAYCDKVIGTGPEALKGQLIKAHYVGRLEDGKVFDSSYNRGKPLTFRVGVGEVIKGWDEGIVGGEGIPPMLAGGKRKLKIPAALGYGSRGAGCSGGSCIIPPASVLLFDVELIGKA